MIPIAICSPRNAAQVIDFGAAVQMVDTICQEFRPPFPSTGLAKKAASIQMVELQASPCPTIKRKKL
jgi:hypothetical protein